MSIPDSKRIISFDLLKGFGILLVIIGHLPVQAILKTEIYAFHMPLFFFVSGCFFHRYDFKKFLTKKAHQLLIPYLFFATILFIFLFLLRLNDTHVFGEAIMSSVNSVIDGIKGDENAYVLYNTIWFLFCLFEVSILFWCLSAIFKNTKHGELYIWLVVLIFYCVGYFLEVAEINLPYFIDTALSVLIYYYLGHIFFSKKLYDKSNIVLPSVFILLFIVYVAIFPYKIDIKLNLFPWYSPILAIAMIVSLLWVFNIITAKHQNFTKSKLGKALMWCGANSLAILGFQVPVIEILNIIRNKILAGLGVADITWCFYLCVVIEFFVVITICYLCAVVIDKLCPILLGKSRVKE